jgi:putative ABC transport system permease protein
MQAGIAQSLSQRRLGVSLVASFRAIALLLASIGIYGVLTCSVVQPRKEIAICMALGFSRAVAIKLIVQQAGRMVVVGFSAPASLRWWPRWCSPSARSSALSFDLASAMPG